MTKRSKSSIERRMAKNSAAHSFGVVDRSGGVTLGEIGRLRYSRIAGLLPPEARAEFERDRLRAGRCPEHGLLDDPAILLVGEGAERRTAFACPFCSGPELRARWEAEGAS